MIGGKFLTESDFNISPEGKIQTFEKQIERTGKIVSVLLTQ